MQHNYQALYLTMLCVYMVFLTAIGAYMGRRAQKSGAGFLMGDRSLPFFLLLGTIIATLVGTGSSMGAVGFSYKNGFAGMLYGLGGGLGMLLLALWFADIRKYSFFTMAEELSFYYGANKTVKTAVSIMMACAEIGWIGAHIIGGGLYLSWITGIDYTAAKIIVAAGFSLFVFLGGYMAVVWTDTIQAVILFSGFILMAFLAVPAAGGWQAMMQAADSGATSLLGIEKVGLLPGISLAANIGVGVLATPTFRQRIYTGKNLSAIKKSFLVSAGAYLIFACIPAIVGMAARAINPNLAIANFAFPMMATEVLPPLLGGLMLISGLSATMSSGSSDAIAASTMLAGDLYYLVAKRLPQKKNQVRNSRIALLIAMGAALFLTLASSDVVGWITGMIATVMAGTFVAAILGKFWPRATWQGGIAAIAGGSLCSIAMTRTAAGKILLESWGNPILPSLGAALLLGVVFSLASKPNAVSKEEALKILEKERLV